MNVQHLAVASVPIQPWGQIYDSPTALKKGTVFQDLDMPFYAADESEADGCLKASDAAGPRQKEQEEKMQQIYQVSFAADDLRLYLDTHPQDGQARDLLKNSLIRRRQLMKDFAQDFFPLTMDCMAESCHTKSGADCYCWQEGPMPWEGACV